MDAQTERARLLNLVNGPWLRTRARAQTIVEYVLLTSSVLVVALAAAALFGQSITQAFQKLIALVQQMV